MSWRKKLETSLGLTRGDLTVALTVAGAALFGFFYLTFLGSPVPDSERFELLRLEHVHDSAADARERQGTALKLASAGDSVPAFTPLTDDEIAFDSATDESARTHRTTGRGGKRPPHPVNINAATKSDLTDIPGIGEKTADAIVQLRVHVPFRRPEDIMQIKGIGPKKFEKMKPFIRVR